MPSHSYVNKTSMQVTDSVLIIITTICIIPRVYFAIIQPRKLSWDDYLIGFAYLCFLSNAILYLSSADIIFRLLTAASTKNYYPEMVNDGLLFRRIMYAATTLYYMTVWSVKLSFLALYRMLLQRLSGGIQVLWWVAFVFTIVSGIAAELSHLFACGSPAEGFRSTGCISPAESKGVVASLWYVYAADVVTDLMIMLLPIILMSTTQMPLKQKLRIGVVFCLVFICITASTIRVVEVGSTITATSQPSPSWVALWGTVEAAIAVIIGCAPGLYRGVKYIFATHGSSSASSGRGQAYAMQRSNERKASAHNKLSTIGLPDFEVGTVNKSNNGEFIVWGGNDLNRELNARNSEIGLTDNNNVNNGRITVTKSFDMFESNEVNHDVNYPDKRGGKTN